MAESEPHQNIHPLDVLQFLAASMAPLTTSIDELRAEITELRRERATKALDKIEISSESSLGSRNLLETNNRSIKSQYQIFEPFARLPVEIRRLIWRMVAREPRVASARIVPRHELGQTDKISAFSAAVPILSVSREAREMALETLKCLTKRDGVPKLYLNPDIDTVWVIIPCRERGFGEETRPMWRELPKLEKVAFDWKYVHRIFMRGPIDRRRTVSLLDTLDIMGVRTLLLLIDEDDQSAYRDITIIQPWLHPEDVLKDCQPTTTFLARHNMHSIRQISWVHIEAAIATDIKQIVDMEVQARNIVKRTPAESDCIFQRFVNGMWTSPTIKYRETWNRTDMKDMYRDWP